MFTKQAFKTAFTIPHDMPDNKRAAFVADGLRALAALVEKQGMTGLHQNVPMKDAQGFALGTYGTITQHYHADGRRSHADTRGNPIMPVPDA